MNKIYTKPAVEITALNTEDIIMASVEEPTFVKTTVNGKTATDFGVRSWAETFGK